MVDIDTHKTVDMIDSRDVDKVSNWLKTYPNIEIVCRDGAVFYFNAINECNENIIQVSDRFHLIKNLTKYCKEYLYQYLKKNTKLNRIKTNDVIKDNIKNTIKTRYYMALELFNNDEKISKSCQRASIDIRVFKKINSLSDEDKEDYFKTNHEIKTSYKEKLKEKLINKTRKLYKEGLSKTKIGSILEIDRRTVDKYLKPSTIAQHHRTGEKFGSKLDSYKKEAYDLFIRNKKSKDILIVIKEKGYKGSYSLLRQYLSTLQKGIKKNHQLNNSYEVIKRKTLIKLLYKPFSLINNLDKKSLREIYQIYPNYKKIIELINEFKSILKKGNEDYLYSWINKVSVLNIKELNSFINGINRDILAVINAVKYNYSNGLAEGSVNKAKLIKRIMYGRSSFETLKTKILRLELYR